MGAAGRPVGERHVKYRVFSDGYDALVCCFAGKTRRVACGSSAGAFLGFRSAYGRLVADGHTTTLQVSAGGFTKKVELLFLDAYEGEKARESSRPLRVLMIIRGWFNDPGAVDLRKYDQMVIDAAR